MFLDIATITVTSGDGGDGCVSVRREKYVPRGGPDGGNGGSGGSVWFEADPEMGTLLDFRYRREYKAGAGKGGGGNRRTGADGAGRGHPACPAAPCCWTPPTASAWAT